MIHQKLLEFQRKGITVEKDGTNPHFKSRYTSLNEVLRKVKPVLNDLGVVIIQAPEWSELEAEKAPFGLTTTLYDTEDGTEVSCFVAFIGAVDMQKLGGAITYARRYSLVTLLGLEDEDDDGNSASQKAVPKPMSRSKLAQADYEAGKPPFEDDPLN